jgi:hypothetical protein
MKEPFWVLAPWALIVLAGCATGQTTPLRSYYEMEESGSPSYSVFYGG